LTMLVENSLLFQLDFLRIIIKHWTSVTGIVIRKGALRIKLW
jgi:hypothetical protein